MSTHPIRSPILQAVLDALRVRPMTLPELAAATNATHRALTSALSKMRIRGLITGECLGRDRGRPITRYSLAEVAPVACAPTKQARIEALLSDTPQTEIELARLAGMDQASIRRLLETLRSYGLAVPTTIDGKRPLRAWVRPQVSVLDQWITGALFRDVA